MPKATGDLLLRLAVTDTASRAMVAVSQVSGTLAKDFKLLATATASFNKTLGDGTTLTSGLLPRITSLGTRAATAATKTKAFRESLVGISTSIKNISGALATLNPKLLAYNGLAGGAAAGGVAAGGRAASIVPGGIVTTAGASSFPAPIPAPPFNPGVRGRMPAGLYRFGQPYKQRAVAPVFGRVGNFAGFDLAHGHSLIPPSPSGRYTSPASVAGTNLVPENRRTLLLPPIGGSSYDSYAAYQKEKATEWANSSHRRTLPSSFGRSSPERKPMIPERTLLGAAGISSLGFRGSSAILGGLRGIGGMVGLGTAAGGAFTLAGLATLGVAYSGVKNINKYENTLASIRGITGGSMFGVNLLAKQQLREGGRTPLTPSDYGLIQLGATRAGFSPKEILNMTPAIGKFHLATGLPIPQITNTLAATGRQFNFKSSKDYQQAVDAMFYAGARTTTSVDVLQKGLGFFGGTASVLGMSFAETMALMGQYKQSKGGFTKLGFRSFSTALMGMFKNPDKFKKIGVDLFTSSGAQRDFFDIFGEVSGAYNAATDEGKTKISGLFSGEREVIHALRNWDKVKALHSDILINAPGATQRAYLAPEGTLKRSTQKFGAKWQDLMIKGGFPQGVHSLSRGSIDALTYGIDILAKDTPDERVVMAQQIIASGSVEGKRHVLAEMVGKRPDQVTMADARALVPRAQTGLQKRQAKQSVKLQTVESDMSKGYVDYITDPNVLVALSETDYEAYGLALNRRVAQNRPTLSAATSQVYAQKALKQAGFARSLRKHSSFYSHVDANKILPYTGAVLTKDAPTVTELFAEQNQMPAFQALGTTQQTLIQSEYARDRLSGGGLSKHETNDLSKYVKDFNPSSVAAAPPNDTAMNVNTINATNLIIENSGSQGGQEPIAYVVH